MFVFCLVRFVFGNSCSVQPKYAVLVAFWLSVIKKKSTLPTFFCTNPLLLSVFQGVFLIAFEQHNPIFNGQQASHSRKHALFFRGLFAGKFKACGFVVASYPPQYLLTHSLLQKGLPDSTTPLLHCIRTGACYSRFLGSGSLCGR